MFQRLNTLLDNVAEVDNYWSDFGISDAVAAMEQFSDSDWQELEAALPEKPDLWRRACAEVLGQIFSDRALQTLVHLLRVSRSEDVVIATLESIQEMANEGWDVSGISGELLAAVDALRSHAGPVAGVALDGLKKRFA